MFLSEANVKEGLDIQLLHSKKSVGLTVEKTVGLFTLQSHINFILVYNTLVKLFNERKLTISNQPPFLTLQSVGHTHTFTRIEPTNLSERKLLCVNKNYRYSSWNIYKTGTDDVESEAVRQAWAGLALIHIFQDIRGRRRSFILNISNCVV